MSASAFARLRRRAWPALLLLAALGWAAPAAAAEAPENMILHDPPRALPELAFADGEGRARSLAEFRGRVVLLNLWATWCGPCRHEMPTLDRLQAELGGADFEVVALSLDRAGADAVRKFYADIGVEHLALYIDSSFRAGRTLSALGLPTTLLIDRDGREIGRLVGPAEWDTPEMVGFIESRIAAGSTAAPMRRADSTP